MSRNTDVALYPDGLKTYPCWMAALKKTHVWLYTAWHCFLVLRQGVRTTLKLVHLLKVFPFWMKQRQGRGVVSKTGSWIKAAMRKLVHLGPIWHLPRLKSWDSWAARQGSSPNRVWNSELCGFPSYTTGVAHDEHPAKMVDQHTCLHSQFF